jgi:hypothetical protein
MAALALASWAPGTPSRRLIPSPAPTIFAGLPASAAGCARVITGVGETCLFAGVPFMSAAHVPTSKLPPGELQGLLFIAALIDPELEILDLAGDAALADGRADASAGAVSRSAPEDIPAITAAPDRLALPPGPARLAIEPPSGVSVAASADVSSVPNEAFLWTGMPWEEATAIARSMGGDTLEGLMEARGITMPPFVRGDPESEEAWQLASARYAAGLVGRVRVLVGSNGIGPDTVLNTIEVPTAETNPLVTNIKYIYPFK